MNGKERLTRIFQGKEVDRPALKLWGLKIGQKMLHPSYQPVYDLALEISDIMQYVSSPFNIFLGSDNEDIVTIEDKPLPDSYWVDRYRYIQLPDRKLRSIHRYSTIGEPGYEIEHLVKEPDDLRALLHLKYNPFPIDISSYQEALGKVGDRGIVVFKLDHAAYAVSRIMGSECFALMCMDERELIKEAVDIYAARNRQRQ